MLIGVRPGPISMLRRAPAHSAKSGNAQVRCLERPRSEKTRQAHHFELIEFTWLPGWLPGWVAGWRVACLAGWPGGSQGLRPESRSSPAKHVPVAFLSNGCASNDTPVHLVKSRDAQAQRLKQALCPKAQRVRRLKLRHRC